MALLCLTSILLLLASHFLTSRGQTLTANLSTAKLTRPCGGVDTAWDGNDTIYLFNGHYFDPENGTGSYTDITKYSISRDTIQVAGNTPGVRKFVPLLNEGSGTFSLLYYNTIYRFFPTTGEVNYYKGLPIRVMSSTSVTQGNKTLVFFNFENPQDILQFDQETDTIVRVGDLVNSTTFGTAAYHNDKVYVFMNEDDEGWSTRVVTVDPNDTSQQEPVMVPNSDFRMTGDWPTRAFSLGRYIYLGDNMVIPSGSLHGIVRYDPVLFEFQTVPVVGWPAQGNGWVYSQGGVIYVEQYHRLYMFGGQVRNPSDPDNDYYFTDNIWYINLPI